jgi:tRNA(Ile)-lysidine synthase
MRAGDRVGVAVSGGADSVALLGLLLDIRADLGVVLSVVHFNHKLRGKESDEDEQFVRELAKAHELDFFCDFGDTRAHAAERKCGIEAAARELRYQFFWKVIEEQKLWRIATAHTLDDQAETVLLRFLRGAGTRGLSGIHPFVGEGIRTEEHSWQGEGFVRPLLDFRRAQLRHYLKRSSQVWREDSSNVDTAFARNKLRQELMPKVREFNPAIEQVLSETAEMARAEEEFWSLEIARTLRDLGQIGKPPLPPLDIDALLKLAVAVQRRIVRRIADRAGAPLEFHHVQQILDLAASPPTRAEKTIELPHGFEACVRERELWFRSRCPNPPEHGYEIPLSVPGEVEVPDAGLVIATRLLPSAEGELLDPDRAGNLRVRNWRPGDRYWPGHTREPKKVKELLQARHVPAQARAHWPVVVGESGGDEQIVWVPGFAFPEQLLLTNGGGPGLMMEHRVRK